MDANHDNLSIVLTVEEVSQLLCIGRNTAYELVRSGQICSVKVGRIYRIPRAAVDEYLGKAS